MRFGDKKMNFKLESFCLQFLNHSPVNVEMVLLTYVAYHSIQFDLANSQFND